MYNVRMSNYLDNYGYTNPANRNNSAYKHYNNIKSSTEKKDFFNPSQAKRSQNFRKLRQTVNDAANSKYFKEDIRGNNNNKRSYKMLRSTINGNFDDLEIKKQQFGKSLITEISYGGVSKGQESYSIPYFKQDKPQPVNYHKKSQYNGLFNKNNLLDQIQQLKKQRERRLKQNQLKNLDNFQEDIRSKNRIFGRKNYVQYYTPHKVTMENDFQQQKSRELIQNTQRISKSPITSRLSTSKPSASIPYKKTLVKDRNVSPFSDMKKQYSSPVLEKYMVSTYNSNTYKYNNNYNDILSTFKQINFTKEQFSIKDFYLGKCLGEGKFGSVYRSIHKPTKALFAVKKVPKQIIKSNFMIDQFILQIKLQSFLEQQNVLKIYGFTHDTDNVYLILQYMEQGNLFKLFKLKKTLSQSQAAVYLKQICKAVKFIHENAIAHRDIKPQNIVMSNGVCKLCDFGWATVCSQRRKTYCGTFDYAAPQILQGIQYDMSVDLWCLGILAYELMVGQAPFYDISKKQTMKKIMNVSDQSIDYPKSLSKEAVSFIDSLLKKDPNDRMNSDTLLNHPFLQQAYDMRIP